MVMYRSIGWVIGILMLLGADGAMGVPIVYDEVVDGDLNQTKLLNLDFGANTVTGSTQWIGVVADHDSFKVTIPTGGTLASIAYSFSNVVLETGTVSLGANYNLVDDLPNTLISQANINVVSGSSPTPLFVADLPVTASTYRFEHSLSRGGGEGGSWDYTLQIIVADSQAVPEPAITVLLLTGLAVSGVIRQRRRPSAD